MELPQIVAIDAKAYVRWLLTRPPLKKIPDLESLTALAVARYLSGVAPHTPNPGMVEALADDIWGFAKRLPGESCSREECLKFLDDFAPYFLVHDCRSVIECVEALKPEHAEVPIIPLRPPNFVEYRITEKVVNYPAAVYVGKGQRKRWPGDDISLRYRRASEAMEGAGCRRPMAFVSDVLKELGNTYADVQHVKSRIETFSDLTPETQEEVPTLLHAYWSSLDPKNRDAFPRFSFEPCDC